MVVKEEVLTNARAFNHQKDPESQSLRVQTTSKPYRYIEGYCLRGPKGDFESLDGLRKRAKFLMTLQGNLVPCEGRREESVTVEVQVRSWSLYAHPEDKYSGVWLHSKQAEYRLGKPSAEYEPLVRDFNRSVQYAIAIHLFVNDVVGVDDTDEDQVIGLDMLLELMTDQSIDRDFVQQNGCVIYDLLRDLNMNKNFPFMLELKLLKPSKAKKSSGCAGSSSSIAHASSKLSNGSVSASASQCLKEAPVKRRPGRPSKADLAAAAATTAAAGGGGGAAAPSTLASTLQDKKCAAASSSSSGRRGQSSSEEASKAKRRRKDVQLVPSFAAADSMGGGGAVATAGGGFPSMLNRVAAGGMSRRDGETDDQNEGPAALDIPIVADPKSMLDLSEEVPKLMNQLAGHNNRLVRLIEDQRPDLIDRQLQDVEQLLNALHEERFEPMNYLVAGTYGGEAFFHPLFDLYKVLKRVRFSCSTRAKSTVALLRKRVVQEFTNVVLRDVWYVQHRAEMLPEVREIKESEKAVWIAEKFERRQVERTQERAARAVVREERRQEQEKRRAATAERRAEWERGHLERKAKRRLEKLAKAQAAAEAAAATGGGSASGDAAAGGCNGGGGATILLNKRQADQACDGEGAAKRTSVIDEGGDGGNNGGRINGLSTATSSHNNNSNSNHPSSILMNSNSNNKAHSDPTASSPDSNATDNSALSSLKLSTSPSRVKTGMTGGAEESKCTLSPMLYGGRSGQSSGNGGNSNSRRLMAEGREENFGSSSRQFSFQAQRN